MCDDEINNPEGDGGDPERKLELGPIFNPKIEQEVKEMTLLQPTLHRAYVEWYHWHDWQ